MEEKKILTDEELDNVVGGKKAAGYVAVSTCLGVDKNENLSDFGNTGIGFVFSNKIKDTYYAFGGKRGAAQ